MTFRYLSFLSALMLSAGAVAATPQLGEQKSFKQWAVACDNRLSCEAVSLPLDDLPDTQRSIILRRDAQSGEIEIELFGLETTGNEYRLVIDRKVAHRGGMPTNAGGSIRITGKEALRLARRLALGSIAILDDGAGKELARFSLAGSRQALVYIDRMQNRAGTATALASAGRKNLRAKWMPAPVITAKRVVPVDRTPDATALVSLAENSACKDNRLTVTEDSAYSLGIVDGKAKALVLISCGSGAYNFSSAVFIATEAVPGKWSFAPAQLDYDDGGRMVDGTMPMLINAGWDASTQRLGSFNKGRGLGDCGEALEYVWDGAFFRLVEASRMDECRGSLDWLTVWTAEVKLVD